MKQLSILTLSLLIGLSSPLAALAAGDAGAKQPEARSAEAGAPMVDGECRKVDKEAGKITIKHGPIPNLEMPGMTMVFRVKDPAMLDRVKAGDKIKFAAEKVDGALVVTKLEAEK